MNGNPLSIIIQAKIDPGKTQQIINEQLKGLKLNGIELKIDATQLNDLTKQLKEIAVQTAKLSSLKVAPEGILQAENAYKQLQDRLKQVNKDAMELGNIKINTDAFGKILSGVISYTDKLGQARKETYGWYKDIESGQAVFAKLGTTATSNIQKIQDTIDKAHSQALKDIDLYERRLSEFNGKLNGLQSNGVLNNDQLKTFSNYINNLSPTSNKQDVQQLNQMYSELIKQQTQYQNQIKTTAELESKLNNSKGNFNSAASGVNDASFIQAMNQRYDALITTINNARNAGRQLTQEELNDSQQRLQAIDRMISAQQNYERSLQRIDEYQANMSNKISKLNTTYGGDVNQVGLRNLQEDINKLSASTPNLEAHIRQLTIRFNELQTSAIEASKSISSQFMDAFSKLGMFMGTGTLFFGAINAAKELGSTIVDLDTQVTELMKVMSANTDFTQLMKDGQQAANQYGASLSTALSAMVNFAQAGFEAADAVKLTNAALLGQNVTGIEAARVADAMTGALSAYSMTADQAIRYIDKVNEVDNNFAVTSAGLVSGLQKASETAMTFGVSLDQTIGMITAITTATRESGNVVGNSLKTMFARLTDPHTAEALASIGVQVTDLNGEMRSASSIYADVASKWDSLSRGQQEFISKQMAGAYHITRFNALMNNWNIVTQASATAQNSLGSSMEENRRYMNSLEAKMNLVKSSAQELAGAIGEGGLKNAMSTTLGVVATFIKGIDSIGTTVGSTHLALGAALTALIAFELGLTGTVPALAGFAAKMLTATEAASAFAVALAENPLTWVATAAIGITYLAGSIKQSKEEFDGLSKAADDANKRIKEIQNTLNTKGSTSQQDVSDYQKMLDFAQKAQTALTQLNKQRQDSANSLGAKIGDYTGLGKLFGTGDMGTHVMDSMGLIHDVPKDVEDFTKVIGINVLAYKTWDQAIAAVNARMKEMKGELPALKANDYTTQINDQVDKTQKLQSLIDDYNSGMKISTTRVADLIAAIPQLSGAFESQNGSIIVNQSKVKELMSTYQDAGKTIINSLQTEVTQMETSLPTKLRALHQEIDAVDTLSLARKKASLEQQLSTSAKSDTGGVSSQQTRDIAQALKLVNDLIAAKNHVNDVDAQLGGIGVQPQTLEQLKEQNRQIEQRIGLSKQEKSELNTLNQAEIELDKSGQLSAKTKDALIKIGGKYADINNLDKDSILGLISASKEEMSQAIESQITKTKNLIDQTQTRINAIKAEMEVMLAMKQAQIEFSKTAQDLQTTTPMLSGAFRRNQEYGNNYDPNANLQNTPEYNQKQAELKAQEDALKGINDQLDKLGKLKDLKASLLVNDKQAAADAKAADQAAQDAAKKAEDARKKELDDLKALETSYEKAYEAKKKLLDLSYTQEDYNLSKLNTHSDAYIAGLQKQIDLKKQSIALDSTEAARLRTSADTFAAKSKEQAAYEASNPYTSNSSTSRVTATSIGSVLGGVLSGKESLFAQAANKYGIDPALLMAIAMHETGNGTSYAAKWQNNVGGMMGSHGLMTFESLQAGIDAAAKNLANNYISQGLKSIQQIQQKYAPIGAGNDPNGLNKDWINGVSSFYKQITGNAPSSSTNTTSSGLDSLFNQAAQFQQDGAFKYKQIADTPAFSDWVKRSLSDCSQFVQEMFKKFLGIDPGRNTTQQWNNKNATTVDKKNLQAGDLVFFNTTGQEHSHVGIYQGNNKFYQMGDHGLALQDMNSSYWAPKFDGAKRFSGVGSASDITQPANLSQSYQDQADANRAKALDYANNFYNNRKTIDETYQKMVEAKLGQFDDKTAEKDRVIKDSQTRMSRLDPASSDYANEDKIQITLDIDKQNLLHAKNEFIKSIQDDAKKNPGKYSGDFLASLQKMKEENSQAWADLQNNNYALENDKITKSIDSRLAAVQKLDDQMSISKSNQTGLLTTDKAYTDEQKKQLDLLHQKAQLIQQNIDATQQDIATGHLNAVNLKDQTDKLNQMKVSLYDVNAQLRQQQLDVANQIVDLYKQAFDQQKQVALDAIQKQMDAEDKRHTQLTNNLNAEKQSFNDVIQAQLKLIDNQTNAQNYSDQLNTAQKDAQTLQNQINVLALDDSIAAKQKRTDLQTQLTAKLDEINKMQAQHETDLRKQNLQDQLDTNNKNIDAQQKAADDQYNAVKDSLDKQKTATEKMYTDLANDERRYTQIREDILKGNFTTVQSDLDKFKSFLTANMTDIGTSITNNLIDKISQAKDALKMLNNSASNGTFGNSSSGSTITTTQLAKTLKQGTDFSIMNVNGTDTGVMKARDLASLLGFNSANTDQGGDIKWDGSTGTVYIKGVPFQKVGMQGDNALLSIRTVMDYFTKLGMVNKSYQWNPNGTIDIFNKVTTTTPSTNNSNGNSYSSGSSNSYIPNMPTIPSQSSSGGVYDTTANHPEMTNYNGPSDSNYAGQSRVYPVNDNPLNIDLKYLRDQLVLQQSGQHYDTITLSYWAQKFAANGYATPDLNLMRTITHFDTGGFTGSWGKDGKLAVLHEKELVLNQDQTNKFMKLADVLKNFDMSKIINNNVVTSVLNNLPNFSLPNLDTGINKNMQFNPTINVTVQGGGSTADIGKDIAKQTMDILARGVRTLGGRI